MSGNTIGGKKSAAKILAKDPTFYSRIGSKGGQKSSPTKGFGDNRERAAAAGRIAGKLSKRGHKYLRTENGFNYYIFKATGEEVKFPIKD
jgi:hypothetical protein